MRRKDLIVSLCVAACAAAAPTAVSAQITGSHDKARAETKDQFIRLDSRTGAISRCRHDGTRWTCEMLPDRRDAPDDEIERLEAENARLKSQLARRETTGTVQPANRETANRRGESVAAPKTAAVEPATVQPPQMPAADLGKIELPKVEAPSTVPAEIARSDGFLSRAWQHLIDLAKMLARG